MAEGAQLPWKVQKINQCRGPITDYSSIYKSLPSPPSGKEWKRDENTREWILQTKKSSIENNTSCGNSNIEKTEVLTDLPLSSKKKTTTNTDVEGVDYVEHTVLPQDTFQGICLTYGISATKLRQANRFSGSNLLLAPSKLIIPLRLVSNPGRIKLQDKNSPEMKIHSFLAEIPQMRRSEAKSYLELCNWDVEEAIANAIEDSEWEKSNALSDRSTDKVEDRSALDVHVGIPVSASIIEQQGNMENTAKNTQQAGQVEMKSLMTPLIPSGKLV